MAFCMECLKGGVEKPVMARGWCSMHYTRWREHGDLNYSALDRSPVNVGDRFGRWTVLGDGEPAKWGRTRQFCQCDCGTTRLVDRFNLKHGITMSCGCLTAEVTGRRNVQRTSHGQSASKANGGRATGTYMSWQSMLQRCNNPDHIAWDYYGGRGVRICDRWLNFEAFFADMGERPEGRTIDRIDPHGNYEPSNCRWATAQEQADNQRHKVDLKNALERIAELEAKLREAGIDP